MSPRTRRSISSRIGRTSSTGNPEGSRSSQSRYRFPGKIGAGVTAAHRDHDVGRLHHLGRQRLRVLLGQIEADLVHHGDHGRVDLVGRRAARRPDVHTPLRVVIEQGGGHLRPAGVVDADEQHLGDFLHDLASHLCDRRESFPSEPLRQEGHVDLDPRPGQTSGRLRDDLTNGFRGEDPLELLRQPSGPCVESKIHLGPAPEGTAASRR